LERAHSLLTSGHRVVDACIAVGFASTSAFSRVFRKHFGFRPSEVRRV
jgi:AraC-like DNA-binding protein